MRLDRCFSRAWIVLNRRTGNLPAKLVEDVGRLIAAWRAHVRR
jgi:hypothetical protein